MRRFESIYKLNRMLTLKHQPPLSLARICEELECSASTAKRCIEDLRTRFGHPLVYDRERNGYRYDTSEEGLEGLQLPGLWFNSSELYALLSMQRLLQGVQPGFLEKDLAPIERGIARLIERTGKTPGEVAERIRVIAIAGRGVAERVFERCADAVLSRRRLRIEYQARGGKAENTRRELSPQHLVHYRDNWYLDAYCHMRKALRTFSLEQIEKVEKLEEKAIDVEEQSMDEFFRAAYGIFSGAGDHQALLRFNPRRALWVAKEQWHPEQRGRYLDDGSWELTIPYGKSDELIMDILRYGPDVEVIEPEELRVELAQRLREALKAYG